jgi:hypothetical protein
MKEKMSKMSGNSDVSLPGSIILDGHVIFIGFMTSWVHAGASFLLFL